MSSIALPQMPPRPVLPSRAGERRLHVVAPMDRGRWRWSSGERAWRRFASVAVAVIVAVGLAIGFVAYRAQATSFAATVDGYVMVEPGRSLAEVARQTVPAGGDVDAHLEALRQRNGADDLAGDQWRVVFLPAQP